MSISKRTFLQTIGAVLILAGALWAYQDPDAPVHSKDKGAIVVSKETTHWTEPLGDDGLPDFRRIVLDAMREGVTPENNGAVQYWQAIWPGPLESETPERRKLLLDELAMEEPMGPGLVGIGDNQLHEELMKWLAGERGYAVENVQALDEAVRQEVDDDAYKIWTLAQSQPWTPEQIPPLAQWVADNREPLDLLVEASEKPRYYSPSLSMLEDDDRPILRKMIDGSHSISLLFTIQRALLARAMLRTGSGDLQASWTDIDAGLNLSRHTVGEFADFPHAVLQIIALDRTVDPYRSLLNSDVLSSEIGRQILADLSARPKFTGISQSFDNADRMLAIEAALHFLQGDWKAWLEDLEPEIDVPSEILTRILPPQIKQYGDIDANVALRALNARFDRIVQVARAPAGSERIAEAKNLHAELNVFVKTFSQPFTPDEDLEARSRQLSDHLACIIVSNIAHIVQLEWKYETKMDLLRIAAALAVYRSERGEYPESLAALTPALLAEIPADSFHGKPLVYRRTEEGYLLYSLGPNGRDDGGNDDLIPNDSQAADDITIRMPPPREELPIKAVL